MIKQKDVLNNKKPLNQLGASVLARGGGVEPSIGAPLRRCAMTKLQINFKRRAEYYGITQNIERRLIYA